MWNLVYIRKHTFWRINKRPIYLFHIVYIFGTVDGGFLACWYTAHHMNEAVA